VLDPLQEHRLAPDAICQAPADLGDLLVAQQRHEYLQAP
jgi:hypothetical protein